MPSQSEIDDAMNQCVEAETNGRSQWPGMTYEQGVLAALRWVTDDGPHPIDEP